VPLFLVKMLRERGLLLDSAAPRKSLAQVMVERGLAEPDGRGGYRFIKRSLADGVDEPVGEGDAVGAAEPLSGS
jgi:hypothetical protein